MLNMGLTPKLKWPYYPHTTHRDMIKSNSPASISFISIGYLCRGRRRGVGCLRIGGRKVGGIPGYSGGSGGGWL